MPERKSRRIRSVLLSIVSGGAALLVVVGIVQSPGEAFRASLSGLEVWWKQVFPGLVPPMILAELLAASGLLHGLAFLAEPITRSWFRLPGAAGWAIAFGWSAGVPAGAKETGRLLETGLIRHEETDTLLLVSHVPNPFLVVVIAGAGFLQSPALGWAMAAGVWIAAILTGIVWSRLKKPHKPKVPLLPVSHPAARIRQAARAAAEARQADGRPLGKQLADSVTHTVGTLMTIGGLMMMASVVLRLVQITFPGSDAWLAISGLYEMHLGAYDSSRSPLFESAPAQAAALLAAALAWTGWSGLLQARAVYGNAYPFPWLKLVSGKLLHAALALLITVPMAKAAISGSPAFLQTESPILPVAGSTVGSAPDVHPLWTGWRQLPDIWLAGLGCLAVFLLLALLAALIRPKPRRPEDHPPPPPQQKNRQN